MHRFWRSTRVRGGSTAELMDYVALAVLFGHSKLEFSNNIESMRVIENSLQRAAGPGHSNMDMNPHVTACASELQRRMTRTDRN